MKHNKNAFAPEAATDEPASSSCPFATPAEEAAWWAGVQMGLREAGHAAEDTDPADPLAFDPVPVRHRDDGLTPEKQREYVEALADTGIGRAAAARIGVSERSIARMRRRADAGSFNLACEAGRRIGARNLHATAWERAIEGTLKGHYYHGELKSEERVYDNRLLIYLLGKTEHLLDEPPEAAAVAANWEPFVEAMEQGLPPPDLGESGVPEDDDLDDLDEECSRRLWQEYGTWWTSWPPPAGFDGVEHGSHGDRGYRRVLSDAELEVVEAEFADEGDAAGSRAAAIADRDDVFGFEGGDLGEAEGEWEAAEEAAAWDAIFPFREAGLSGPSEPSDPPPHGESRVGPPPAAQGGQVAISPGDGCGLPGAVRTCPTSGGATDPALDQAQHGGGGGAGADAGAAEPAGDAQPPAGAEPPVGAELYEASWLRAHLEAAAARGLGDSAGPE